LLKKAMATMSPMARSAVDIARMRLFISAPAYEFYAGKTFKMPTALSTAIE
jgi:hypothetical protein